MFGEAVEYLDIVYCSAVSPGIDADIERCMDRGIQYVPTWDIDGQLHVGVKTLQWLAQASGYEGG
jgi:hypothetical protein